MRKKTSAAIYNTGHWYALPFALIVLGVFTGTLHTLAASPLVTGITGRYFEDCNEATNVDERDAAPPRGVAAYALDGANAERLWDLADALLRSAGS